MGNIVSYTGQDDGEVGMNQLIPGQEGHLERQNPEAASGEPLSSEQDGDVTTPARTMLIQRSGVGSKSLSTLSQRRSRYSQPPKQKTWSRQAEEQRITSRSPATSPEPVRSQQVEPLVAGPASRRRLSLFARSLILSSATLGLVSTLLFLVSWKLLQEPLGVDLGQNASAMMRLLLVYDNASSSSAPGLGPPRNSSVTADTRVSVD
ncbi:hypothetical protein HPB47_002916 [Ixodes persulcatus]|uniref:Uncharacterized protein n=1 Tax=Ixodes persulcatus TaxID=34615 RepID=A0AC60PJY2_IXOPE|nr:hypothetical protein HPB47_002916 [Ixodes persulcatus]